MLCPYKETRFGDQTGIAPLGYPALDTDELSPNTSASVCSTEDCAYLATDRKQDYLLDPGSGLTDGFFDGATTTSTTICPLNDLGVISPVTGLRGRGRPICAYCYSYVKKYYDLGDELPDPGVECIADPNRDGGCFVCADASMQTLNQRWLTVAMFLLQLVLCIVFILVRVFA